MRIITTEAPATEPVSKADVKKHLRPCHHRRRCDGLHDRRRPAGSAHCQPPGSSPEQETGRALITQTKTLYLDEWPDGNEIRIPYPPLQTATVTYRLEDDDDYDNTLSTVGHRHCFRTGPADPATWMKPGRQRRFTLTNRSRSNLTADMAMRPPMCRKGSNRQSCSESPDLYENQGRCRQTCGRHGMRKKLVALETLKKNCGSRSRRPARRLAKRAEKGTDQNTDSRAE